MSFRSFEPSTSESVRMPSESWRSCSPCALDSKLCQLEQSFKLSAVHAEDLMPVCFTIGHVSSTPPGVKGWVLLEKRLRLSSDPLQSPQFSSCRPPCM